MLLAASWLQAGKATTQTNMQMNGGIGANLLFTRTPELVSGRC
jgi:hypothetical protein